MNEMTSAERDVPTRVSDLPPFKELRVYRDPNVPAPLVICRVCGAAILDSYALVHRKRCVTPPANPTPTSEGGA